MNYTKLASEARKLYTALRDEEFDAESACEIVKVCVRDYPIFREMIEKEQTPEEAIGYLYFTAGDKAAIYSKEYDWQNDTITFHTSLGVYRKGYETVYEGSQLFPTTKDVYYAFDGFGWERLYTVDHIEMFI